ncbi:Mediator complex, subunit Med20 [Penicillium expansum]|uniref:Mediator of RNA polymerase II transcription subunit 20 n=1 Tax=Penicillium expansum TaxID=27334 RepID=A0A0A2ICZ0_PENEN|nr:Mediator complex, subunit Med20 [Penicillium expansum]KGO40972.1 Mediator complex, subunit Med20 [Penicillium expansum]KGO47673.1 Mediator complex, subunit Med20 [Penicillium expansum]KGO56913.1 Mediator complex, subunit Med20 [Penicillium expansum]
MPITGVYFIPSNPNASTALQIITERLRAAFPNEELTPIGRWGLEQKLLRDTPGLLPSSSNSNKKPPNPRYMQFLSLTHYPTHGFIYTSEPEKPASAPNQNQNQGAPGPVNAIAPDHSPSPPMVMTTIPPSSYGTLFQHFTYACQPFWSHRLTLAVPNGIVYEVGDFRVRLGDVRQTFPTARVRGTVVEIEWRGPSVVEAIPVDREDGSFSVGVGAGGDGDVEAAGIDLASSAIEESDIDAEYAATASLIREFWGRLGVEAREAILIPNVGKEVKDRLRRWKMAGSGIDARVDTSVDGAVPVVGERTEDDPDPWSGADVARQFMEVLRFNR